MPDYRAKVGADGTVALPPALCRKLKIVEGSEVEFFLTLEGDVFFHAITGKAKDWKGMFETEVRSPPVSIREMDAAIGEAIAEDHDRILRQAERQKPRRRQKTAAE